MKIIPSFKPSVSYRQLNGVLAGLLFKRISGKEISDFEQKFSQYLGIKYAIRVTSGRMALYSILQGMELQKGDEVILSAFTYFAVPAAIIKLGLKPVFVDINPENLDMDIKKIEESITDRTRVIIITHLCGFACKLDAIIDIAKKYDIKIIEDCAQSLGAEYQYRKTGSFGDAAYFTFGVTKNFTTLGGGMIVTNNDELASLVLSNIENVKLTSRKFLFFELLKAYIMKSTTSAAAFPFAYLFIRVFSYFGIDIIDCIFRERSYIFDNLPVSGRLSAMQSELGVAQLEGLDCRSESREIKGIALYRMLQGASGIRVPLLEKDAKNTFSSCPVFVKNRIDVKNKLLNRGLDVSVGYMQDCSGLGIFKEFRKNCPNASKAEKEIIHLPMYVELTDSEIEYIAKTIKGCAR